MLVDNTNKEQRMLPEHLNCSRPTKQKMVGILLG